MPDTTETRDVEIVRRLRAEGHDAFAKQYSLGMWKLCDEAADLIERLSRELQEAKEAISVLLEAIDQEEPWSSRHVENMNDAVERARSVPSPKKDSDNDA